MSTLREHLEAIRDRHTERHNSCFDESLADALAALKLLDEHWHAERMGLPYQDTCRCGLMDMDEYQT